jgi:hypothetical protein
MSFSASRRHTGFSLFMRSLEPTSASIVTSLLITGCLTGGHLLLISLNNNVAPSALHDPAILQAYENFIMNPLLRLTDSTAVNNVIAIILWGLFGWGLYAIVALVAKQFTDWHAARRQIRLVEETIVSGSQEQLLEKHVAWRLFIVFIIVVFSIAVEPLMHYGFANSYRLIETTSWQTALQITMTDIGIWVLMLHGYVVLLRLYLGRTRILGEIIY